MTSVPGFNTDIKWQDRVYHVQTENIASQQQVESLIFAGGEILAAKRTSYIDPVSPLQPAEVAAFLHHQHQVITSVIKSGFIEELHHRETVKELERLVNVDGPTESPKPKKAKKKRKKKAQPKPEAPINLNLMDEVFGKIDPRPAHGWRPIGSSTIEMTEQLAKLSGNLSEFLAPPPKDDEEFEMIGDEEGAVDEGDDGSEEEGDEENVVDLIPAAKLQLHIYGRDEFYAGDNRPLQIVVKAEDNPFPIKNAEVTVKLVGTAFRPMLWKQITGADGLVAFDVNIPPFTAGTAAFIIDAIAAEGECQERFAVRRTH
jgi:hypothetical protein